MRPLPRLAPGDLSAWARDYAYAARQLRDPRPASAATYRRPAGDLPAVVLLPGVYERWTFLRPLADLLAGEGYDVHVVEALRYNRGSVAAMAAIVDAYLRRAALPRVVLVAHSKGGLVGKYLLAHHNADGALRGLVAVNTPFGGSSLARLLPLRALRTFVPGSPELVALSREERVNRHIVSVYGTFDPHIPGGSHLDGARNVQVAARGHFLPLGDPLVHRAILDAVASFA